MITGGQIRAARALLGWNHRRLSEESGVPFSTVKRIEAQVGEVRAHSRNIFAIQKALATAGIEFVDDEGIGVILRPLKLPS